MKFDGKLSVVMPAYNEGERIYNNILATEKIIAPFAPDYEIVVVNDGSRDNTRQEIERAKAHDDRIVMVSSETNHGKGSAILAGIAEAAGEYIAFLDADLELNPSQLEGYYDKMTETGCDAVIGCKLHKDSQLVYPLRRKIMSVGYYMMLRLLFHLKIRDTQTGLKLFRAKAVKPVAHLVRTSGFAYDIELLVAVSRRGGRIEEKPVKVVYVRERNCRRIKFDDVWKAFRDTLAIWKRANVLHYYDDGGKV